MFAKGLPMYMWLAFIFRFKRDLAACLTATSLLRNWMTLILQGLLKQRPTYYHLDALLRYSFLFLNCSRPPMGSLLPCWPWHACELSAASASPASFRAASSSGVPWRSRRLPRSARARYLRRKPAWKRPRLHLWWRAHHQWWNQPRSHYMGHPSVCMRSADSHKWRRFLPRDRSFHRGMVHDF